MSAPFPRPQVTGSPDKASRAQPLLCKYLRSVAQVRVLMWVCGGVRRGLRSSITRCSSRICAPVRVILFETSILPPNELRFVSRYNPLSHDGLAASQGRDVVLERYLLWDYNEERKNSWNTFRSIYRLRVPEYYIYRALDQPAKAALREIVHALIRQYAFASESYAPKFVCP